MSVKSLHKANFLNMHPQRSDPLDSLDLTKPYENRCSKFYERKILMLNQNDNSSKCIFGQKYLFFLFFFLNIFLIMIPGYCNELKQSPQLSTKSNEIKNVAQKNVLSECTNMENSIKIGMTRGEVEQLFTKDGGTMGIFKNERYVHKDCFCQNNKVLKMNISFKPFGISNETYKNPDLFQEWYQKQMGESVENPKDEIIEISEFTCEYNTVD